jgi:hypothetical protein
MLMAVVYHIEPVGGEEILLQVAPHEKIAYFTGFRLRVFRT